MRDGLRKRGHDGSRQTFSSTRDLLGTGINLAVNSTEPILGPNIFKKTSINPVPPSIGVFTSTGCCMEAPNDTEKMDLIEELKVKQNFLSTVEVMSLLQVTRGTLCSAHALFCGGGSCLLITGSSPSRSRCLYHEQHRTQ